jgi:hypothetical protein
MAKYGIVGRYMAFPPDSPTGERRHFPHCSTTTYLLDSMNLWAVLRHGLGA